MARTVKRPRPEPQAFHQLGVRGRKTGVVLQDRGDRDEHGMQPIDSIFSPHEGKPATSDGGSSDAGSGEMEMASSDGPGPQTLLKNRHSLKHPIPKSRSPIKTHLNSPAKKNPHLDHLSSPSRSGLTDDRDATVTRKLDFTAKADKSRRRTERGVTNGSSPSRPSLTGAREVDGEHGQDLPVDPVFGEQRDLTMSDLVDESMQMFNAMKSDNFTATGHDQGPDDLPPAAQDDSPDHEPQQPPLDPSSPTKSPQLPPPRKSQPSQSPSHSHSIYGSRKRPSLEVVDEREEELPPSPPRREDKSQRTSMPPPARPGTSASRGTTAPFVSKLRPSASKNDDKPVKRGRGRPRKTETKGKAVKQRDEEEGEGDESFMEIQRGPPMPRSRGLVSLRNDGSSAAQTRSRRRSVRPMDYWREEKLDKLEHDVEQSMQEVVRVPLSAPPSSHALRSKTRTKAKANITEAVEEDEELEDWEMEDGIVNGDIVLWEPEHELNPPGDDEEVNVTEERLAIAADAIQTQEIENATSRFAKTLTLPFMGAGVVDLPPDAEKRPKNSRKMHMVFFVHYGKVLVTINEMQFRISAGGTWFVPRGNYYSITNDYEVPARIFFAQACHVTSTMIS
ncbi:mitotic fidelity of chromosome transmission-related protein [Conoideocrella luteorostrata]|uniref:CENP-C homolog n=1 Tax=Conoideocrella luteorostrata TaxID=1105319 RepID=A0AAJ0CZV2_9HYPO|nr:mitotic fidelity of chromosome transmission-related protein [Conoideocrella luteorostrata]